MDASADLGVDATLPDLGSPTDAGPPDAGPDLSLPGRDAGPPDAGRADAGPDTALGSCMLPIDFDSLATADVDGSRTYAVDLSGRADYRALECSPAARGPDAVLRITAPAAGRLVIDTLGAADTILSASAACDDGVALACNDDVTLISGRAAVAIDVTAAQVLFVVLDTFSTDAASAPISVRARLVPTAAVGEPCDPTGMVDTCATGALCAGDGAGATRCTRTDAIGCDAPIELNPLLDETRRNVSYHGTTVGAPDLLRSSCQTGTAPETVHRLRMPFRGRVRVDVRGRLVSIVAARSVCTDAASERFCERRGVVLPTVLGVVEADAELFFIVEAWADDSATYELELNLDRVVDEGAPCVASGRAIDVCDPALECRLEGSERVCRAVICGDGIVERDERCDPGASALGDGCSDVCQYDDSCAAPIELSTFGTVVGDVVTYDGSTTGARNTFRGSCSTMNGSDRVFVYTPVRNGTLTVSTVGPATTFDTVLYVQSACAGAEIGCNDDFPDSMYRSQLDVPVVAATPVYIVVDGWNPMSYGAFRLTATLR